MATPEIELDRIEDQPKGAFVFEAGQVAQSVPSKAAQGLLESSRASRWLESLVKVIEVSDSFLDFPLLCEKAAEIILEKHPNAV